MKKVVITGGAGFIGTMLSKELLSKGYSVVCLDKKPSRIKDQNLKSIEIDLINEEINPDIINGSYAVINLAGAPIFGRFTDKYQDLIVDSRLKTTNALANAITLSTHKPDVFVSASAIGYYGNTENEIVKEDAAAGDGFLSHLCRDWENMATGLEEHGLRVVVLRTAYVLGQGGLLGTLVPLFKKRIGGYFGNGKQMMPFVSAEDLVSMYIHAIENTAMSGAYNTSVMHATQKDFMKIIAKNVGTKFVWRIPKIFGYLLYLSFVNALTEGVELDSNKIIKTGFKFKDTNLEKLIKDIYEENYR